MIEMYQPFRPSNRHELKDAVDLWETDVDAAMKTYGDIATWDVTQVQDMSRLFNKSRFNGDISKWDVSHVENMRAMFSESQFNGDISTWDVSHVKDMICMFSSSQFKGDISKWDVSRVNNMAHMFSTSQFNGDISKWDVSRVIDMSYMFSTSQFNGDISSWDVSQVRDMSWMFYKSKFNGDISKWDVSQVKNMSGMFNESLFQGDISRWDVGRVETMEKMFGRNQFQGDISKWDVNRVKNMSGLFQSSQFQGDISQWDVSQVKDMSWMFFQSRFNGDISKWDVSQVQNMSWMFSDSQFNGDISSWNVSRVQDMSHMFLTSPYQGDISKWDVRNVTSMAHMFQMSEFNGDVSRWDVSGVRNMSHMFSDSLFNGDISNWDLTRVEDMSGMFVDIFAWEAAKQVKNTEDKGDKGRKRPINEEDDDPGSHTKHKKIKYTDSPDSKDSLDSTDSTDSPDPSESESDDFNMELIASSTIQLKRLGAKKNKKIEDLIQIAKVFKDLIEIGFRSTIESCTPGAICGNPCGSCFTCIKDQIIDHMDITNEHLETCRKLALMQPELEDISAMVSMDEIKDQFTDQLMYLASTTDKTHPMMHTLIMGPPGHGKTHIATLIGKAYQKSGFLQNNKFVVARRYNLIGAYTGHTAKATTAMFDQAKGGVIFIDEVYSLGNERKDDCFTSECIDTINQLLSERPDTMCIIAGYKEEIQTRFFNYNPGLARRFPWAFTIKPYDTSDLTKIFMKMAKDEGWTVHDNDIIRTSDFQKNWKLFNNAGGDVATLITNCKIQHYSRVFLQDQTVKELTRDDVLAGMERFIHFKQHDKDEKDDGPPLTMYI